MTSRSTLSIIGKIERCERNNVVDMPSRETPVLPCHSRQKLGCYVGGQFLDRTSEIADGASAAILLFDSNAQSRPKVPSELEVNISVPSCNTFLSQNLRVFLPILFVCLAFLFWIVQASGLFSGARFCAMFLSVFEFSGLRILRIIDAPLCGTSVVFCFPSMSVLLSVSALCLFVFFWIRSAPFAGRFVVMKPSFFGCHIPVITSFAHREHQTNLNKNTTQSISRRQVPRPVCVVSGRGIAA